MDEMNPAVRHVVQFFAYDHLPDSELKEVSRKCAELALDMVTELPSNPELTAGLRKLLEAKDCFVRAKVAARSSGG